MSNNSILYCNLNYVSFSGFTTYHKKGVKTLFLGGVTKFEMLTWSRSHCRGVTACDTFVTILVSDEGGSKYSEND